MLGSDILIYPVGFDSSKLPEPSAHCPFLEKYNLLLSKSNFIPKISPSVNEAP